MAANLADENRAELFLAMLAKTQHRLSAFIHTLVANWHDGEEILQETLVILWRKFDEFDPQTDFFRWSAKVAQFEVLNYRRKSRQSMLLDAEVLECLAATTIKLSDEGMLRRQVLGKCLQRLSEQDQKIVGLRYEETGSVDRVSQALGKSTSQVHRILRRIRCQLMRCVQANLVQSAG
jgi:RNA polymerase sigma-70 factor, ECF subfamily